MEKTNYSIAEVAHRFSVHPETVRHWIRDGKIKVVKLGNFQRINIAEIERLEGGDNHAA